MLVETFLGLTVLACLYFTLRKPPQLPPGIWGLPIVGHLPPMTKTLADQVAELQQQYGDIITWRMGSRVMVFICNTELIKKVKCMPELSFRPDFYAFNVYRGGKGGIIFANGEEWREMKRFVSTHMKQLGLGGPQAEEQAHKEASLLVEDFRKHTGKADSLPLSLGVAVLNMLWKIVADTHFDLDDPEAHELVKRVWKISDALAGPVALFNDLPWLNAVTPVWLRKKLGLWELESIVEVNVGYMETLVRQHEATFDPSKPRDLIDYFLIDRKKKNYDQQSIMQELKTITNELFLAGNMSSHWTLRWTILFLAKYPEVQRRLQEEVDREVPSGTLPEYKDLASLPYFEAFLNEAFRSISMLPLGLPFMASKEVQFEGHTIPKDTVLMIHLQASHRDPRLWERPHEFYPEHFLDANGKFIKREGLMPFSTGHRMCIGFPLARMEIFIFLFALVQKFSFSAPKGEELSTEKDPKQSIFNIAKPFKVIITERV